MDFRRLPFQFSTTDPLKRQEELQRRFGLPANRSNMYVDLANSGPMGARPDMSSASNSPRLQHRVPIFVEGQSEPTTPSVGAQNVDSGRKPHVRVIPIEIEGEDSTSRKRWLSGSSEPIKERVSSTTIPVETVKQPVLDPSPQSPKAPRICNIPIKIEGRDHVSQPKTPVKTQKAKTPESPKRPGVKLNGCSASRAAKVNEIKEALKAAEKKESPEEKTLKKIQNIEEKLKGYHADVEKFSGTNKDKQYRYLDEMLTRCMLELDEIDTMGLETIRLARKAAVKKVQASVDLLESKINKGEPVKEDQVSKELMEVESSTDQQSEMTDVVSTEVGDDEAEVERTADVEMTDTLPEQINEKVENISIMETEDAVLKPDEEQVSNDAVNETSITNEEINAEVKSPVQITEVGADIAASETEPVVEEPVSDSKDENAIEMDLDSCGCESDSKLDECSVQICEVENDTVSSPSKLEAEANEHVDQNSEMDMTDIPVTTQQSSENSQVSDGARELTAADQSETSIKTNKDC